MDQYLLFDSCHPLQYKLSVIKILLDSCLLVVLDEKDKEEQVVHIISAFRTYRWVYSVID